MGVCSAWNEWIFGFPRDCVRFAAQFQKTLFTFRHFTSVDNHQHGGTTLLRPLGRGGRRGARRGGDFVSASSQ